MIGILTGIIFFSCSPDKNDSIINDNSVKKLVQFTSDKYSLSYKQLTFDIIYDISDNLSEVNFENGSALFKYTYNSKNQIIKTEGYNYASKLLKEKDEAVVTYNSDNQIIKILVSNISYNPDSSISHQSTITHEISYETDLITVIKDDPNNLNKVEYFLQYNLITNIKMYKNNILDGNLSFEYDSKGNCISGKGPINLNPTYHPKIDDVELFISYGTAMEKSRYDSFKHLLQISLLTSFSFDDFRQILPRLGNRLPVEITWYQQDPDFFKKAYEYVYDDEGYMISETDKTYGTNYFNERIETFSWN